MHEAGQKAILTLATILNADCKLVCKHNAVIVNDSYQICVVAAVLRLH